MWYVYNANINELKNEYDELNKYIKWSAKCIIYNFG